MTGRGVSASAKSPRFQRVRKCPRKKAERIHAAQSSFSSSFTNHRDELMRVNSQYSEAAKLETVCIPHSPSRKGFCPRSFFTSLRAVPLFLPALLSLPTPETYLLQILPSRGDLDTEKGRAAGSPSRRQHRPQAEQPHLDHRPHSAVRQRLASRANWIN